MTKKTVNQNLQITSIGHHSLIISLLHFTVSFRDFLNRRRQNTNSRKHKLFSIKRGQNFNLKKIVKTKFKIPNISQIKCNTTCKSIINIAESLRK